MNKILSQQLSTSLLHRFLHFRYLFLLFLPRLLLSYSLSFSSLPLLYSFSFTFSPFFCGSYFIILLLTLVSLRRPLFYFSFILISFLFLFIVVLVELLVYSILPLQRNTDISSEAILIFNHTRINLIGLF